MTGAGAPCTAQRSLAVLPGGSLGEYDLPPALAIDRWCGG